MGKTPENQIIHAENRFLPTKNLMHLKEVSLSVQGFEKPSVNAAPEGGGKVLEFKPRSGQKRLG